MSLSRTVAITLAAAIAVAGGAARADIKPPKGFAPTPKLKPRPWATDDQNRALAGAWTVVTHDGKPIVAWLIEPGKITSYTGKTKEPDVNPLVTSAPCEITVINVNVVGKEHSKLDLAIYKFAKVGDQIHLGDGAAALRTPTGAIVCGALGTFVIEGDKCTSYGHVSFNDELAADEIKPANCSLTATTLTIPMEEPLTFTGEGAMNRQLAGEYVLVPAASFAAARAAVDAARPAKH